jgi:hypothetical protein
MSDLPEIWTAEALVQAVHDGHTFLVPFYLDFTKPNGYYIAGKQYVCSGVTVGPEHTPDINLSPEGLIFMTIYLQEGMVRPQDFAGPLNSQRVGPVHSFIEPKDINWELLNSKG